MHFLLLGIDSLIACAAVATVVSPKARVPFAALFGVADGITFLVGAGLGWTISASAAANLQLGMFLVLGFYLLVVAAGSQRVAAAWPVWVLPLALVLDNLTYGLADDGGRSLLAQASEQALSSTLMALTGLAIGVALPRMVPALERHVSTYRMAGGALVCAAGALALLG
jgi:hypothetical protein